MKISHTVLLALNWNSLEFFFHRTMSRDWVLWRILYIRRSRKKINHNSPINWTRRFRTRSITFTRNLSNELLSKPCSVCRVHGTTINSVARAMTGSLVSINHPPGLPDFSPIRQRVMIILIENRPNNFHILCCFVFFLVFPLFLKSTAFKISWCLWESFPLAE